MKTIPLSHIKAVLFDFDGVLIDSMPYHVKAWQQVFDELGIHIPAEVLQRSEGEKAKKTIGRLAKEHHLPFDDAQLDAMIEKKRSIYRQYAPRGLHSVARSTVEFCRDHRLKRAIVTGSVQPNIRWTLSEEERSLFDTIISSENYTNGKPHPEPYLKAAQKLDIDKQHCLVVENAPLGIQSAKAAGMICVALSTTLPKEELQGADIVIPDLDELKTLFNLDE